MVRSIYSCLLLILVLLGCDTMESPTPKNISIISSSLNGAPLGTTNNQVLINTQLVFVFSGSIDVNKFKSSFSLKSLAGEADYSISISNASTKITIDALLKYSTTYTVNIASNPIGTNGEKFESLKIYELSTVADSVIRTMVPCTSTTDCLRKREFEGSTGKGNFEFYSNYPIYNESAVWENLTDAIIIVHGASHDPENYYSYLTNTLQATSLSNKTVLIAPFFRSTSTGSSLDFYWPSTSWNSGSQSSNSNKISSFKIIDELIKQLGNKARFPVLKKIIITGHSSGAAFTHIFSASNTSDGIYPGITFEYVVANSQYFYYPNEKRISEATNQLYTPSNCGAYKIWPLGFGSAPPYLSGVTESTFNSRFIERKVTYLLGNGNQADPTLNTVDCENTLQGSTRFKRGENMFQFMELTYPNSHKHKKVIVNGIGHDGKGMYESPEFKTLLVDILK